MLNMCESLVCGSIQNSMYASITHLGLKAGAAILGISYSIPFSAVVITGAAAFPLSLVSAVGISLFKNSHPYGMDWIPIITGSAIIGATTCPLVGVAGLGVSLFTKNQVIWLSITPIITSGLLYKASLLGLLGTASIANIVAFSSLYSLLFIAHQL